MTFANLDIYFHMINHYKKIRKAKAVVDCSPPKGFHKNCEDRKPVRPVKCYLHQTPCAARNYHRSCTPECHNVRTFSCAAKQVEKTRCFSAPPCKRNASKDLYACRNKTRENMEPIIPAGRAPQRKLPIKDFRNKQTNSPERAEPKRKSTESQCDDDIEKEENKEITLPPVKSEEIVEKIQTCPQEHEYFHFLLMITEDILRNNINKTDELEKLFESHIQANMGRLDEAKMREQIENLKKEIDFPFPVKDITCQCDDSDKATAANCFCCPAYRTSGDNLSNSCDCNNPECPGQKNPNSPTHSVVSETIPEEEEPDVDKSNDPEAENVDANQKKTSVTMEKSSIKSEKSSISSRKSSITSKKSSVSSRKSSITSEKSKATTNSKVSLKSNEPKKEDVCEEVKCCPVAETGSGEADQMQNTEDEIHPTPSEIQREPSIKSQEKEASSQNENPEETKDEEPEVLSEDEKEPDTIETTEETDKTEDLPPQDQDVTIVDKEKTVSCEEVSCCEGKDPSNQNLVKNSGSKILAIAKQASEVVSAEHPDKTTRDVSAVEMTNKGDSDNTKNNIQFYIPNKAAERCYCATALQKTALKIQSEETENAEYILVDGPVCIPCTWFESRTIPVLIQNDSSLVLNEDVKSDIPSFSRVNLYAGSVHSAHDLDNYDSVSYEIKKERDNRKTDYSDYDLTPQRDVEKNLPCKRSPTTELHLEQGEIVEETKEKTEKESDKVSKNTSSHIDVSEVETPPEEVKPIQTPRSKTRIDKSQESIRNREGSKISSVGSTKEKSTSKVCCMMKNNESVCIDNVCPGKKEKSEESKNAEPKPVMIEEINENEEEPPIVYKIGSLCSTGSCEREMCPKRRKTPSPDSKMKKLDTVVKSEEWPAPAKEVKPKCSSGSCDNDVCPKKSKNYGEFILTSVNTEGDDIMKKYHYLLTDVSTSTTTLQSGIKSILVNGKKKSSISFEPPQVLSAVKLLHPEYEMYESMRSPSVPLKAHSSSLSEENKEIGSPASKSEDEIAAESEQESQAESDFEQESSGSEHKPEPSGSEHKPEPSGSEHEPEPTSESEHDLIPESESEYEPAPTEETETNVDEINYETLPEEAVSQQSIPESRPSDKMINYANYARKLSNKSEEQFRYSPSQVSSDQEQLPNNPTHSMLKSGSTITSPLNQKPELKVRYSLTQDDMYDDKVISKLDDLPTGDPKREDNVDEITEKMKRFRKMSAEDNNNRRFQISPNDNFEIRKLSLSESTHYDDEETPKAKPKCCGLGSGSKAKKKVVVNQNPPTESDNNKNIGSSNR